MEVPKDEVKNAVFDLFDRDDNNIVAPSPIWGETPVAVARGT